MEFNTTDYELSHGHSPRGRGLWAFSLHRNPEPDQVFWARRTYQQGGTFAQAKREARAFFAATDAVVYVLT